MRWCQLWIWPTYCIRWSYLIDGSWNCMMGLGPTTCTTFLHIDVSNSWDGWAKVISARMYHYKSSDFLTENREPHKDWNEQIWGRLWGYECFQYGAPSSMMTARYAQRRVFLRYLPPVSLLFSIITTSEILGSRRENSNRLKLDRCGKRARTEASSLGWTAINLKARSRFMEHDHALFFVVCLLCFACLDSFQAYHDVSPQGGERFIKTTFTVPLCLDPRYIDLWENVAPARLTSMRSSTPKPINISWSEGSSH